jgi:concanavalin A-like lectin/glucanase superfamily protein
MIHIRELARRPTPSRVQKPIGRSSAWSGRARIAAVLGACGALATIACSSDPADGGGAAGASGSANSAAGGGAYAGSGGATGAAGASAGIGGAAGSSPGTGGGSAAGAGGSGAAGSSGSAGGSSSGGGGSGSGGGAGGGGGVAGVGGAVSADCAGHALSLGANGTGTASDAALARVEIDMLTDLPVGTADRTVEVWAYMRSTDWAANKNTLFFYGTNMRKADGFGLDFGANTAAGVGTIDPFTNAIFDNDNQSSGVTTATSQWVHFAMTWNGTEVQAYVNGVLKSTKDAGSNQQKTLMTSATVFTLGGYPAETAYFASYFDELRVWNVAHTAAEIAATKDKTLLGNEPGLAGYWKFNESSGTTAMDSVTTTPHTAHDGTLKSASANQMPTFVVPNPLAPISCP